MIIPESLFQGLNENLNKITRRVYNSRTLRELAREKINTDDKQPKKELDEKMSNPNYFTDKIPQ